MNKYLSVVCPVCGRDVGVACVRMNLNEWHVGREIAYHERRNNGKKE